MWQRLVVGAAVAFLAAADDDVDEGEHDFMERFEEPFDELQAQSLKDLFLKMDTNSDGKVSLAELMAHSDRVALEKTLLDVGPILKEMDQDGNGKLSLAEFLMDEMNHNEEDHEDPGHVDDYQLLETAKFKVADKDGDGELTEDELVGVFSLQLNAEVLRTVSEDSMKQMDTDGDGRISKAELYFVQEGEEMTEEDEAEFNTLDTDSDGVLNLLEFEVYEAGRFRIEGAMKSLIEMADQDGDQHVSEDELMGAKEDYAEHMEVHGHLTEWIDLNEGRYGMGNDEL